MIPYHVYIYIYIYVYVGMYQGICISMRAVGVSHSSSVSAVSDLYCVGKKEICDFRFSTRWLWHVLHQQALSQPSGQKEEGGTSLS